MKRFTLCGLLIMTGNLFAQDTIVERIKIEPLCFFQDHGTFFINSVEEYSSMIENFINADNKDCFINSKLEAVDFEKYTILGFTNNEKGCLTDNTTFTVSKTNNQYKIMVESTATDVCNDGIYICEWYLYPKIEWRTDVSWDAHEKFTISDE